MPRIAYVDVLKGFAIIGIVLQHEGFDLITENLYVPVFFMISGYFFKEERMGVIIRKRFLSLIVPYLWFVFLFFMTKWLFYFLDCHNIIVSLKHAIYRANLFKCNIILHKSIWFLPVLFFITIIYKVISNIKDESKIFMFVLMVYALGYMIGKYWHTQVIYLSDTILTSVIYFYAGHLMEKYETNAAKGSSWVLLIPIMPWAVLTVLLQPAHSYKNNHFSLYLPMMVIPAIFSIFFLLKRMKLEMNPLTKPIQIAGFYSLGILGYHALCNIFMDELKVGRIINTAMLPYFKLLVVVLIVPVLIWVTLRIFPRLVGKAISDKGWVIN